MTDKGKLISFWNSLNCNAITSSKEIFENNIDSLVEFLIHKTLDNEKFEIGLFEDGRQTGSNLIFHDKANQKELELRFKKNSSYELILNMENQHGELFVFRKKVSSDEVKLIPENIRKQMYSVREIERPVIFFNSLTE